MRYEIIPIKGPLLKNVIEVVREKLGKQVTKIDGIGRGKRVKTYKVIIKNGAPLRLDIKYPNEITRLQKIACKTNIEIPKVIADEGRYKFSEWIDGVMLYLAWHIPDVFIKSGDLVGRLNLIEDPGTKRFLTNCEFSSPNALWTKDGKVYIIDHGMMTTSLNPDMSVVQILLKRIREKERINLFLEAYSKHRSIDNIKETIEKMNWNWNKDKTLVKTSSVVKLKY